MGVYHRLQAGAEAEAVGPVERTYELDGQPARVEALAAQQQHRYTGCDTEQARLALGCHDRLDRLLRPRQLDAVTGAQQLVERLRLAQHGRDPVKTPGVQVQQLDRQRLVISQADPLDLEDLVTLAQRHHGRHVGFGRRPRHADQPGGRCHATAPGELGMARQLQHLVYLRPGHEGALALVAVYALLDREAVQGLAHGPPGDPEPLAQLPLGRHVRPRRQLADQADKGVRRGAGTWAVPFRCPAAAVALRRPHRRCPPRPRRRPRP